MTGQQAVQEILGAWREAERQLEQTRDPDRRAELRGLIERLKEQYSAAVTETEESPAGPANELAPRT